EAVQAQSGAADDGPGQCGGLLGGADRGPVGADADGGAERLPTGVDVEAHAHGGGRVGGGGGDEVEVAHRVDHEGDPGRYFGGGGQAGDGVGVDGGVGHEDVGGEVGAAGIGGQPERLVEGVGHDPGEPGHGEDLAEQGAAADGLAGDPDGRALGPADQVGGVGAQGAQIDDGEG